MTTSPGDHETFARSRPACASVRTKVPAAILAVLLLSSGSIFSASVGVQGSEELLAEEADRCLPEATIEELKNLFGFRLAGTLPEPLEAPDVAEHPGAGTFIVGVWGGVRAHGTPEPDSRRLTVIPPNGGMGEPLSNPPFEIEGRSRLLVNPDGALDLLSPQGGSADIRPQRILHATYLDGSWTHPDTLSWEGAEGTAGGFRWLDSWADAMVDPQGRLTVAAPTRRGPLFLGRASGDRQAWETGVAGRRPVPLARLTDWQGELWAAWLSRPMLGRVSEGHPANRLELAPVAQLIEGTGDSRVVMDLEGPQVQQVLLLPGPEGGLNLLLRQSDPGGGTGAGYLRWLQLSRVFDVVEKSVVPVGVGRTLSGSVIDIWPVAMLPDDAGVRVLVLSAAEGEGEWRLVDVHPGGEVRDLLRSSFGFSEGENWAVAGRHPPLYIVLDCGAAPTTLLRGPPPLSRPGD